MKLIVGLGNPGEKYEQTRHNLGFMVLDELAEKMLSLAKTKWQVDKKSNSQFIKIGTQLILVKPQTMMNASGYAVAKIAAFYHIESENIWVIHDDADLPLGRIKIRLGGGFGGHRGIDSIIEQLGTDKFVRFRFGIGEANRGKDRLLEKYVLKNFTANETNKVKQMIKKTTVAIKLALDEDLERAMNHFNFK
ncbi:aminoacyl-tRNA hydrolase [Patescibacteria group bacterium]|nr:aminoacyl-tRNA hydrolase [Patescibacteria group bacterium]